ncbi:hypothetical protein EVAR_43681_1 [Eumeta japonica]|uniref:Uncharacterized protein n=1 Tax=Eumeta variegata TaxID=151549 RepID=A0A4C1WX04_EUMVA|nr:hypothetical protein EVAR_43681_1 [Eumeta japonica]
MSQPQKCRFVARPPDRRVTRVRRAAGPLGRYAKRPFRCAKNTIPTDISRRVVSKRQRFTRSGPRDLAPRTPARENGGISTAIRVVGRVGSRIPRARQIHDIGHLEDVQILQSIWPAARDVGTRAHFVFWKKALFLRFYDANMCVRRENTDGRTGDQYYCFKMASRKDYSTDKRFRSTCSAVQSAQNRSRISMRKIACSRAPRPGRRGGKISHYADSAIARTSVTGLRRTRREKKPRLTTPSDEPVA